jgi:chromate transporter
MDRVLLSLLLVFAPLSIMSFGGGQAIVADIQHQTVDVYHWMTPAQFADSYAISRVAPGPATLIVALIGWHIAGLAGAVVSIIGIYVPSSILVYYATGWWVRQKDSIWKRAIETGLAPVAVGLIAAACLAVLRSIDPDWLGILTTIAAVLLLYFTRVSGYMLMAAAAALRLAYYFLA